MLNTRTWETTLEKNDTVRRSGCRTTSLAAPRPSLRWSRRSLSWRPRRVLFFLLCRLFCSAVFFAVQFLLQCSFFVVVFFWSAGAFAVQFFFVVELFFCGFFVLFFFFLLVFFYVYFVFVCLFLWLTIHLIREICNTIETQAQPSITRCQPLAFDLWTQHSPCQTLATFTAQCDHHRTHKNTHKKTSGHTKNHTNYTFTFLRMLHKTQQK